MDFTALVDNCAHFVESLIETEDPVLWLTLCGRHCTAATHADLIPPHFTESLTIDTLPAMPEQVISEPDFLCEYCLVRAVHRCHSLIRGVALLVWAMRLRYNSSNSYISTIHSHKPSTTVSIILKLRHVASLWHICFWYRLDWPALRWLTHIFVNHVYFWHDTDALTERKVRYEREAEVRLVLTTDEALQTMQLVYQRAGSGRTLKRFKIDNLRYIHLATFHIAYLRQSSCEETPTTRMIFMLYCSGNHFFIWNPHHTYKTIINIA